FLRHLLLLASELEQELRPKSKGPEFRGTFYAYILPVQILTSSSTTTSIEFSFKKTTSTTNPRRSILTVIGTEKLFFKSPECFPSAKNLTRGSVIGAKICLCKFCVF